MSKIIKITAFFLFFVMAICVKNAFAIYCAAGTRACCVGGKISCCECGSSLVCNATNNDSADAVCEEVSSECKYGDSQNRYTAEEEYCDYYTETRTCCSTGTWSEWNKSCPKLCPPSQCWNGSTCEDAPNPDMSSACSLKCIYGKGWEIVPGGYMPTITRYDEKWGNTEYTLRPLPLAPNGCSCYNAIMSNSACALLPCGASSFPSENRKELEKLCDAGNGGDVKFYDVYCTLSNQNSCSSGIKAEEWEEAGWGSEVSMTYSCSYSRQLCAKATHLTCTKRTEASQCLYN